MAVSVVVLVVVASSLFILSAPTTHPPISQTTTDTTTPKPYLENGFGNIPLEDINGKQIYLKNYQGKIVVLEFMTTWDLSSGQQIKILKNEFYPKYNSTNLVILLVTIDQNDNPDFIRKFITKTGIEWAVL
ncbi:MAG: TlpA family protein disulfide reductase [Thaumarchaeota archaeon]|nr:TlpA family protein disulfide reductase [Nitrososphaerota archaeon]